MESTGNDLESPGERMKTPFSVLSVDLGAESGRVMGISFSTQSLTVEEIYRFKNGAIRTPEGLHWDILRLWEEILQGLALAKRRDIHPASMGVDGWGVDFALLDRQKTLIGIPYHYRDSRTNGILSKAFQCIPREDIFTHTGVQFMPINTLYQLLAMVLQSSPHLEIAETLLMIPDLFHYWLCGFIGNEFTNATTSQCFSPLTGTWAYPILRALGIPDHLFQSIVPPGTMLGTLRPEICEQTGLSSIPIIAPATHDTGAAVVAVPAQSSPWAWISSGTWSIAGVESPTPVIDSRTLALNFTNEGGALGTWRLSKNVMGLWLVQECRRIWQAEQTEPLTYDELTFQASLAQPFLAWINPDHPDFLPPGDLPARIRTYCERTHQKIPQTRGEVVRIILESMALKYRWIIAQLEQVTGSVIQVIHIVGGGSKNRLLNQFTANATGKPVLAGPAEATTIGNAITQAIGLGYFSSVAEARAWVRASFPIEAIDPVETERWNEVYTHFYQRMKEDENIYL